MGVIGGHSPPDEHVEFTLIRPATRGLLHGLAALAAMLAMLVAAAAWRLSSGPISLQTFAPYVEAALSDGFDDIDIRFDDLSINWSGWQNAVSVRAFNVRAIDSQNDKAVAAVIPEMGFGLSVLALSRGLIAPTWLEISGPEIHLVRRPDGAVRTAGVAATDASDADAAGDEVVVERVVAELLDTPDRSQTLGYLEGLSIARARVTVDDMKLHTQWVAPSATIAVYRDDRGLSGDADLTVDVGGMPWSATATMRFDNDTRKFDVAVNFADVWPSKLAEMSPQLARLASINLPVSANVEMSTGADGRVMRAAFDVSSGAGTLNLPELDPERPLFEVGLAQVKGVYDAAKDTLRIDDAFIDFEGPTAAFSGIVKAPWSMPEVRGDVLVGNVPALEVAHYWPSGVAPGGLRWVRENIQGGHLERLTLSLNLAGDDWSKRHLARDRVRGAFTITNGATRYLDGMPAIENIELQGTFDPIDLSIDVAMASSGVLEMGPSSVRLRNLGRDQEQGEFDIAVEGPISEALALLSLPRFRYTQAMGLDPDAVGGEFVSEFRLVTPLRDDPGPGQWSIDVLAELSGVATRYSFAGVPRREVSARNGHFSLVLNTSGFHLGGAADVDGETVNLSWHEIFEPAPEGIVREITVAGRVTETARRAIRLADPRVAGPIDLDGEITGRANGSWVGQLALNLDAADVFMPMLRWTKPAAENLSVLSTIRLDPDGRLDISDLEIEGTEIKGFGAASLEPGDDGRRTITFQRLSHRGSELSVKLVARDSSNINLTFSGKILDLRPFILDDSDEAGDSLGVDRTEPDATPVTATFEGEVDELVLSDEIVVRDANVSGWYDGEKLSQMRFHASVDAGSDLSLRVEPSGSNRLATLSGPDAGAVARAFGLSQNMVGGALHVEALLHDEADDADVTGFVRVDDFRVVDAPLLARVLTAATLTGALEMLDGGGLAFNSLEAPFGIRGDVLTIERARASGISIGLTMNGRVLLSEENLNLKGTIVPAYMLNSLIGRIPLIGDILTGGEGSGVFAATYRVTGTMEEPDVSVNPLTALAPGILRELFSAFGDRQTTNGTSADGAANPRRAQPGAPISR